MDGVDLLERLKSITVADFHDEENHDYVLEEIQNAVGEIEALRRLLLLNNDPLYRNLYPKKPKRPYEHKIKVGDMVCLPLANDNVDIDTLAKVIQIFDADPIRFHTVDVEYEETDRLPMRGGTKGSFFERDLIVLTEEQVSHIRKMREFKKGWLYATSLSLGKRNPKSLEVKYKV